MRQGDLYIFRIDDFPKGEKYKNTMCEKGQLALGEVSHHDHRIDVLDKVNVFKIKGFDALSFLDVKENCKILHGLEKDYTGPTPDNDYHWSIDLKKGKYITGIVEETDWIAKTIRKVVD